MRLFDNLIGLSKKEAGHLVDFYLIQYNLVMKDENNKREFLLKLKELRHDLRICDTVLPELNQTVNYQP